MAGENLDNHNDVKNILIDMGTYFQVQVVCYFFEHSYFKIAQEVELKDHFLLKFDLQNHFSIPTFLQDDYLDCFGHPDVIGKVHCAIQHLNGVLLFCIQFASVFVQKQRLIDFQLKLQIGTDIEDFKCSWLVVKALELSDEKQKTLLHVSSSSLYQICFSQLKKNNGNLWLSTGELWESR